MSRADWRIRLGAEAERDFAAILQHTSVNFGLRQAEIYRDTLIAALGERAQGPEVAGSVPRDHIAKGLRTLHVARHGRRGRHFIMFRAAEDRVIEIVRILHDAMDLARHVPPDEV